jgi:hypothetical protein
MTTALVAGSMIAVVCIRFFTENLGLLPRVWQYIDVGIAAVAGLYGVLYLAYNRWQGRSWGFEKYVLLFSSVCVVSFALNGERTSFPGMMLFLYGTLAPIVIFVLFSYLRPSSATVETSLWVFNALGLLQLLIGGFYDFPLLMITRNPDVMAGTFGFNAYQGMTFVGFWLFWVVGTALHDLESGRGVSRLWLAARVALIFGMFFAAQYRAMMVFLPLLLIVLVQSAPSGGVRKGAIMLGTAAVAAAALLLVAQFFPEHKLLETMQLAREPEPLLKSGKVQAAENTLRMFADRPKALAIGTGPGTYSSRAYRTLVGERSGRGSDVAGEHIQRLFGEKQFTTDVAREYIDSIPFDPIDGGTTLSVPYASWLSLPAETGIPGFLLFAAIYWRAFRFAWSRVRAGPGAQDRTMFALSFTCAGSVLLVIIQGFIDNWLEVTRVTIPLWLLILCMYVWSERPEESASEGADRTEAPNGEHAS